MKPTVFVEGGGAPGDVQTLPPNPPGIVDLIPNGPVGTRNALADSLYVLFEKAVPALRIHFDILLNGGYQETVKKYADAKYVQADISSFLMVDYQDINGNDKAEKHSTIQQKIDEHCVYKGWRNSPVNIAEQTEQIFFMVQKMDAWILSQPDVINTAFSAARRNNNRVTARIETIRTRPITEVRNPDDEMRFLMRCYEEEKKGEWKKLSYGKIKTVVRLLPLLDIDQLRRDFDDVQRFVTMLKSLH